MKWVNSFQEKKHSTFSGKFSSASEEGRHRTTSLRYFLDYKKIKSMFILSVYDFIILMLDVKRKLRISIGL